LIKKEKLILQETKPPTLTYLVVENNLSKKTWVNVSIAFFRRKNGKQKTFFFFHSFIVLKEAFDQEATL